MEFQNRIAFPAACLVFALLGVPIGVRPRRGGRAAGLILTLVLIGGYYFLLVSGDHWRCKGGFALGWDLGGEYRRGAHRYIVLLADRNHSEAKPASLGGSTRLLADAPATESRTQPDRLSPQRPRLSPTARASRA